MVNRKGLVAVGNGIIALSMIFVGIAACAGSVVRGTDGNINWKIGAKKYTVTYQASREKLTVTCNIRKGRTTLVMTDGPCKVSIAEMLPAGGRPGLAVISSEEGRWPLMLPATLNKDKRNERWEQELVGIYLGWTSTHAYAILEPSVANMIGEMVTSSAPPRLIESVVSQMVLPFGYGVLPDENAMKTLASREDESTRGSGRDQDYSALGGLESVPIFPHTNTTPGGGYCFDITNSRNGCNSCCTRGMVLMAMACAADPAACGMAACDYMICNGLCEIAFPADDSN
jgi:hypothetical protein